MSSTFGYRLTKWTLDVATRLVRANVRVHNAEAITDDMAIIFVVNHFTRLETLLLPYFLHRHTGREVWSLAAGELFVGKVGAFLRSTGTISTKDPDRDQTIVKTLLAGVHPWLIFPEGAMIKDKKVIDANGAYSVYHPAGRRPPHTGPAVLALRTEYYRHKIRCLSGLPEEKGLRDALNHFALESADETLHKRTVLVPLNVTYYPIRARENVVLRIARALAGELSPRAVEELSVEGTVLGEDTDIDMTLGEPIDVRHYLDSPEYAAIMACGDRDLEALEADPRSLFNSAAQRLMLRYMADIYRLTTINIEHLFAAMIRYQDTDALTEQDYRERLFLCVSRLKALKQYSLHPDLESADEWLLWDAPAPDLRRFVELCLKHGVLTRGANGVLNRQTPLDSPADFHAVRVENPVYVIANELEPVSYVTHLVRGVARAPREAIRLRLRETLARHELRRFEDDYARFQIAGESKAPRVGRPFLLESKESRGGVVLIHGYMAAPLEIRALAKYLNRHGYAVYAPRLQGHGTAPEDLAATPWEAWYAAVERGLRIMQTMADTVVVGGFSMGGILSLLAAARRSASVHGVFCINAPLRLQSQAARFAPSVVRVNALLRHITPWAQWEYVENRSENPHINYVRNPLHGVSELARAMRAAEDVLGEILAPLLVIQDWGDPVVDPQSGEIIFSKAGSADKELTYFNRGRHGIVNGPGSEAVFERVYRFLRRHAHGYVPPPAPDLALPPAPEPAAPPTGDDMPEAEPASIVSGPSEDKVPAD